MSCCSDIPRSQVSAPLFQIRRGWRARWNDLTLSVELDSGQWLTRVDEGELGQTVYRAYRAAAESAKLAAAEFAVAHTLGFGGQIRSERLVTQLEWKAYWTPNAA